MTTSLIARASALPGFTTAAAVPQWQPANYQTAIHETAAAAYNQIRFLGLSRDHETLTIVRNALRTALDLDSKGQPPVTVARPEGFARPDAAAVREFFVTFFQTYSARDLNGIATASAQPVPSQPPETDQLIEGGWLSAGDKDPGFDRAYAANSVRDMMAIALSLQLENHFKNHDAYTAQIRESRNPNNV